MIVVAIQAAFLLNNNTVAFDPWHDRATYDITYTADVSSLVAGGASVRLWMPVPADRVYQTVTGVRVDAPWAYRLTADADGNRFIYIESTPGTSEGSLVVLRATVQRRPVHSLPDDAVEGRAAHDTSRFLRSSSRIPVDGVIATLADRVSGRLSDRRAKIRSLYDYVVHTMRYDKTGTGWGLGDAMWACQSKYGNCTDFHSLLIGMARSQKIPARFVIGFPLAAGTRSGRVTGYHCWAELQESPREWLPVDASEAKKSNRADAYFGVVPSDRIEFTMGRDLVLSPPQDGGPLNFFIYPYAEVNGSAVRVPWTLTYERTAAAPDRS